VVSVERIPELADRARETLEKLGYRNVEVVVGDGTLGWPDRALYDRIIVTAGAPRVPAPLKEQLADGGILVIPVGASGMQTLTIITREGRKFREKEDCACVFVKLIGQEGWGGG